MTPNSLNVPVMINFDLDTKALEKNYHSKSWRNGYSDIKNELQKYGYVGIEGSTYLINGNTSFIEVAEVLDKVGQALPWLKASTRDLRLSTPLINDNAVELLGEPQVAIKQQTTAQEKLGSSAPTSTTGRELEC